MKQKNFLTTLLAFFSLFILASTSINAYSNDLDNTKAQDDSHVANIDINRDDWYSKPSDYAELVSWYQALETAYPEYIELFKANELYDTGQATGGYDLYYVRITNESLGFHKPEVLFLGGPHGDETVGTIGMYWFLDWFTRKALTDEPCTDFSKDWLQWILDNREIYFEISHNPYGFSHGPQREDGNGWDLNREADYDGPGSPTGGIWGSENGKTLVKFINNHTIRVGCDIHGGARMMLYPWAETHTSVQGTSPISGETYSGSPPDFYFYDVESLRLGAYMGNCGGDGDLDETNTGPIKEIIWYAVYGGICPWGYAADVVANPAEDPYVEDETYGNYPGAGILWHSPEMSNTKNPSEASFGNDTTSGWGWEMRRFILHETDIAQPYVRWQPGTIENDMTVEPGQAFSLQWQVNGSLVVDHTSVQWGTNPDPITIYTYATPDYDDYEGGYIGGTGWDDASDGMTNGITYAENMTIYTTGDYYFVAKAQVDQIYGNVLSPSTYGNDPYLRLLKERTNASYYESLSGTDGLEEIVGQTWWYSPIIHVHVDYPPDHDIVVSNLEVGEYLTHNEPVDVKATVRNGGLNDESDVEILFKVNGTVNASHVIESFPAGNVQLVNFTWQPPIGTYNVSIEATLVPDENVTDNNVVYQTVYVIPAPSIWVTPQLIEFFNTYGLVLDANVTIGNEAFADVPLYFNCSTTDESGYGWLSVNMTSGTVLPGHQLNIAVSADTTGMPIGLYSDVVEITSNDPEDPLITVEVNLTIVHAYDTGAVTINSPTGAIPSGETIVNASITNFGYLDQTSVLVNCSIFEGGIGGVILDEDFSTNPSDWTITHVDGTAWTWDSYDERMENTYGYPNAGYLDSPVLDCSGKTGVSLSFWHYWWASYSGAMQDGYVRGSIDGGATFPYLIDEFHDGDPDEETAVKDYDIAWADGQSNVVIRFDVYNYNDWYWYIDDVNVSSEISGNLVYYAEAVVDVPSLETRFVEFSPAWNAGMGLYGILVTTLLPGDQNVSNNMAAEIVSVEGPGLAYDPGSYNFGSILVNTTDATSFDVWNDGVGILTYTLDESASWVTLSSYGGTSSGEHDAITVIVNTTGLATGAYHCDVDISSDGGSGTFSVDMFVVDSVTPILDVEQTIYDRGFPIRHAIDGDWGAAQSFTPTMSAISGAEVYLRKFGTPEFDLTIELREDNPEGTLLDTIIFTPGEVGEAFSWIWLDFADVPVTPDTTYFVVIPPAPSGVTTSFGYEWGYAFGDQYDGGSFWFTRNSGALWRDLPTMYEFAFKTYGYL